MPHFRFGPGPSSLRLALVQALVIGLLPLGTAFAQSGPSVRVTNEETEITARTHGNGGVIMTAARGTVLTVIDTDGDRYAHRRSNWYWVLLPRDAWGATRGGWISGRDVDYVPPTAIPMAAAVDTVFVKVQTTQQGFNEHSTIARALDAESRPPVAASSAPASPAASPAPAAAPAAAPCPCAAEFSEMVVLNFEFAKSELTIEAKGKLASAVATLKTNGHGVSFALEGHADWIGSEPYNDRLGRARAETVKKYLADLHQIPADKISVVSYGESKPAASNATPDGRAQNRRVVVKVGA